MTRPVQPVVGAQGEAPGTILDYASPGLKKKLRLPSRSILTFYYRERELAVVESVQAKASAIVGLAFAGFVLLWLGVGILTVPKVTGVFGTFWLIEFVLLLLVVHDTWRTTTLTVNGEGVDLRFASPFRRKQYRWAATDFRHAAAYATDLSRHPAIGVLNLSLGASAVRLFDGHEYDQLAQLAAGITQMIYPGATDPLAAIPIARTAENP